MSSLEIPDSFAFLSISDSDSDESKSILRRPLETLFTFSKHTENIYYRIIYRSIKYLRFKNIYSWSDMKYFFQILSYLLRSVSKSKESDDNFPECLCMYCVYMCVCMYVQKEKKKRKLSLKLEIVNKIYEMARLREIAPLNQTEIKWIKLKFSFLFLLHNYRPKSKLYERTGLVT